MRRGCREEGGNHQETNFLKEENKLKLEKNHRYRKKALKTMRAPTRLYVNQPSMQTWVKEVFLFPTDPSLTSPLCCVLRRLAFMDHINPLASFQSYQTPYQKEEQPHVRKLKAASDAACGSSGEGVVMTLLISPGAAS